MYLHRQVECEEDITINQKPAKQNYVENEVQLEQGSHIALSHTLLLQTKCHSANLYYL